MSMLSTNKQVNVETSAIRVYTEGRTDSKIGIGEKKTAVLMFDDNGMVRECNQAAAELLDCSTRELTGQPISRLFPELTKIILVHGKRAISCLRFLSYIAHRFEVVSMSGARFASELYFSEMENTEQRQLRVIINPAMENSTII